MAALLRGASAAANSMAAIVSRSLLLACSINAIFYLPQKQKEGGGR